MLLTVLRFITAPIGKAIAIGALVLTFLSSAYIKGRRDANRARDLKEVRAREYALEKAGKARARSDAKSDAGGLYDNDGFRRD